MILQRRQRYGFPLLELLSVIVILSIMAVAAVPAFSAISRNAGWATGGQVLIDQLRLARQAAIESTMAGLFDDASKLDDDLELLGERLIANQINYQVFRTPVALRGSKWSLQQ